MAIVSGFALPFVMIAIRNYIIKVEGMEAAGYWEAMNRISVYYLMFVNSIMTLYFLPRFQEIENKKNLGRKFLIFIKR